MHNSTFIENSGMFCICILLGVRLRFEEEIEYKYAYGCINRVYILFSKLLTPFFVLVT